VGFEVRWVAMTEGWHGVGVRSLAVSISLLYSVTPIKCCVVASPLKILCTGDLHLGRYPTRLATRPRELSVEAVWDSSVQLAIAERVDLVCLTGDVADRENAFFESYGPLLQGMERLRAAGIKTLAVSGNHDYDVLSRLAQVLPEDAFHFVGRNRSWEVVDVAIPGKPEVSIVGWSFATQYETTSPLPTLPAELPRNRPLIGLLHADLDVAQSRYLPVTQRELDQTGIRTWLLGHIHAPRLRQFGSTQILYPGSPQPLHPGETGDHGPWLVTVGTGGNVSFEHRPLATLRYERIDIDLTNAESATEIDQFIVSGTRDHIGALLGDLPDLKHVSARIMLTGEVPFHRELPAAISRLETRDIPVGSLTITIDKIGIATRPVLDLGGLAERRDPAGELAELVLALRRGEDPGGVVKAAMARIRRIESGNAYAPLDARLHARREDTPLEKEAKQRLENQALLLLHQLSSQIEEQV